MDGQATVTISNGKAGAPATVIVRNLGDCARDVVELAELQARLLSLDLKQSVKRAVPPVILAVAALIFLLASFPVALAAVGYALVELADWSYTAAFFAAAGIGLLLAVAMALAAWVLVRRITGFERSRAELAANLVWLKDVLSNSGRVRHRATCP